MNGPTPVDPSTHTDQARCVVLVVDDETIILWGTASMLESLGYRVIRANTGSAALEALRDRQEIGALLTDFQMPGMSGIELAETARQLFPNLPVVIATGHTTLKNSIGRPWVTLAKPFTRDELGDAVKRAIADA
jgi:DNA-binding NtrC family response regulator